MKDAVANQPYFKAALNKTNGVQLVNLSAPQLSTDGKPFVPFTLQCNFPEVYPMKRLSREKRNQLIIVIIVTVAILAMIVSA